MEDDVIKKVFANFQHEIDSINEGTISMESQINEMIAKTEELASQVDNLDEHISIFRKIVGI